MGTMCMRGAAVRSLGPAKPSLHSPCDGLLPLNREDAWQNVRAEEAVERSNGLRYADATVRPSLVVENYTEVPTCAVQGYKT